MKSIFLHLLTLLLLIGCAAASAFPVYALGGEEVQQGFEYLLWSNDGGGFVVDLAAAAGESCPRYVVPNYEGEGFETARSVVIVPENRNDNTIRMNTTVYIKFAGESACNDESTLWNLDGYVKTGGVLPSPSDNGPHNSRFSINFADGVPTIIYEIRSCPCGLSAEPRPSCRMGCLGRIGRTEVGDDTLFGLNTDESLRVMFIRSSEANAFVRSAALQSNV